MERYEKGALLFVILTAGSLCCASRPRYVSVSQPQLDRGFE